MAGEKTFYWLRLKKDFFKRHDIKILRNMDDGDEIVLCYLMLLCESVDHEGRLRFSDAVPYDADMLAAVTDTDPEIMEQTIDKLLNLGLMVKEDDGSYFMTKVEKMIGVAQADDQTRESARLRQQAYRDRQKQEKESSSRDSNVTVTLRERDSNVTEPLLSRDSNVIRNGEIEIEKEIEIDIKDNKEKGEKENLSFSQKASLHRRKAVKTAVGYQKRGAANCQKSGFAVYRATVDPAQGRGRGKHPRKAVSTLELLPVGDTEIQHLRSFPYSSCSRVLGKHQTRKAFQLQGKILRHVHTLLLILCLIPLRQRFRRISTSV